MGGLRTVDSDNDEDFVFQTQPKEKRVRTQDIPLLLRYDKYDHWPVLCDLKNVQRCKMEDCKGKSMFKCSKCKIYLCLNRRDCFVAFHNTGSRQ